MAFSPSAGKNCGIEDYGLIGDCRSAALVSNRGSLHWLCWPRFDSPSIFAALLDTENGGDCVIAPVDRFTTERRYLDDTNILETSFHSDSGLVRLRDLMPVSSEEGKKATLRPIHELLRCLECTKGTVTLSFRCRPRPDYARSGVRLRERGSLGIYCGSGAQVIIIRSDIPLRLSNDSSEAAATFTLRAGERRYVSIAFSDSEPAILPSVDDSAERRVKESIRWWQSWSSLCKYEGPYRSAVVRSALALKLLTFAPSGAVIAAPTTSLPERIGGARNWDYRYCWLRDASLTFRALFDLGYADEARAYLSWLLHTTRITWPKLDVLYDVYGRTTVPEQCLSHLSGFAGSKPVRIGNAAAHQLQLDVYGEVIDAVYEFVRRGGQLDRAAARMVIGFGKTVCKSWRMPDSGIWEIRSDPRHHTFSKVMCWVGLDRLIRLHQSGRIRLPLQRFEYEREAIQEAIERQGFSHQLNSYTSVFGGTQVDASLLQIGRYDYLAPDAPRMLGTLEAVLQRLGRNGLIYRYLEENDGLEPGEGSFGICSFWAVSAIARSGDIGRARELFDRLLTYADDLGLFAEEIDPDSGAALGNFPQAFTHVGLIDAALALDRGSSRNDSVGSVNGPTQAVQ